MNIGILSMQQIPNYGSFLQAYGLKRTLEMLGHSVDFIDIAPGRQLSQFKRGRFDSLKKGLIRLKCHNPFKMIYYSLLVHRRFNKEFIPFLYAGNTNPTKRYDVVVIGSDEVFNIAQSTWFGFSPQLFGEGLNTDKVISYAACCGATTVDKLKKLGLDATVGEMLGKNFASISVRDDNSVELVKTLTSRNPEKNIDPVLLHDYSKEISKRTPHSDKRYMLIYTYPNRMRDKNEILAIKKYARSNQLGIVGMSDYFDWVDTVVTPTPFEVLAYFRDASCIVTDTFHGTVMSIKYNKQFVTFVREMNNNKLVGLLSQFSLTDRIVNDMKIIGNVMNRTIDYNKVNAQIATEQEKSIKYLRSNL